MPEETVTLGQIALLRLEPGDRAVLRAHGRITGQVAEHIRAMWEKFAPGVPVLVLDESMELSVLRAPQSET